MVRPRMTRAARDKISDIEDKITKHEKLIADIDNLISSKVNEDISSYTIKTEIGERSFVTLSIKQLSELRENYTRIVLNLKKELDALNHKKKPRFIYNRI